MDQPLFIENRHIQIKDGLGTFDIQMTQEFITRVRDYFHLNSEDMISDNHVRTFIFDHVGQALDELEKK